LLDIFKSAVQSTVSNLEADEIILQL